MLVSRPLSVLLLCLLVACSAQDSMQIQEELLSPPQVGARLQYDAGSGSTLAHYVSRHSRAYRFNPPAMFSAAQQRRYRHRLRLIRERGEKAARRAMRSLSRRVFHDTVSGLMRSYRGLMQLILNATQPAQLGGHVPPDTSSQTSTSDTEDTAEGNISHSTQAEHTRANATLLKNNENVTLTNRTGQSNTTVASARVDGAGRPPNRPGSQIIPAHLPDSFASFTSRDPAPAPSDTAAADRLWRYFSALLDGGDTLRDQLMTAGTSDPPRAKQAARAAFETLWDSVVAADGESAPPPDQHQREAASVIWELIQQFLDAHDVTVPKAQRRELDLTRARRWLTAAGASADEEDASGWRAIQMFTTDGAEPGRHHALVGKIGINWTAIGEWVAENLPLARDFDDNQEASEWARLLWSYLQDKPDGEPGTRFDAPFDWLTVYNAIAVFLGLPGDGREETGEMQESTPAPPR